MRALGYFRRTADECDVERKARFERSTREALGMPDPREAWERRFVAHLDEQAEAHAELVEGSA